jgi:hypothetical protein
MLFGAETIPVIAGLALNAGIPQTKTDEEACGYTKNKNGSRLCASRYTNNISILFL